jgi:3-hydroxyisobutyrate dehydrogenase-like beta-hydroxyacid dehydrogenase
MPTFTIIGAGAMGSAIAERLTEHGGTVFTYLEGRSARTIARAKAAGMIPTDREGLARSELILSIVPPAEAIKVAELVAGMSGGARNHPPFIDCNAIAPKTMQQLARCFQSSKVEVLDGAIIGGPPDPGKTGPTIYVSGDGSSRTRLLEECGLRIRRLDGPLGSASALKMCYAGINKGFVGLATAMLLAASRSGAANSLKSELSESLPELDRKLARSVPDMYPKAYRWVAEMHEIADFLGDDNPGATIFRGMADVFSKMAKDAAEGGELAKQLNQILSADGDRG